MPYTNQTALEEISKSSISYIFSKFQKKRMHAYLNTLILRAATVYIHFSFQPKVRTNSLALFSHNQMQTFLKSMVKFHLTIIQVCTTTSLQTPITNY